MRRFLIKSLAAVATVAIGGSAFAQALDMSSALANQGMFALDVRTQKISKGLFLSDLGKNLGLNHNYSFVITHQSTDLLGFEKTIYQVYFKGIPVAHSTISVHAKDQIVAAVSGAIMHIDENSAIVPAINKEKAQTIAQRALGVRSLMNEYESSLVFANDFEAGTPHVLAFEVRIDGKADNGKLQLKKVYVDALSGQVIDKVDLLHDANETGTAETYYYGTRDIQFVSDSAGHYRLRDNIHNIETIDVGGCETGFSINLFVNPKPYTNTSLHWGKKRMLTEARLSTMDTSFSNALGGNVYPFFQLATPNSVGSALNGAPNGYPTFVQSQSTPITARGTHLTADAPPYVGIFVPVNVNNENVDSARAISFDVADTSVGLHQWSSNGNSGYYKMADMANFALDAHWGMTKTLDYYLQKFQRSSYNGNGSLVKNFINGVFPLAGTQNNAMALPHPYNAMAYGIGDGIYMNPLVNLDVLGHEFTHMVTANNGTGGLTYRGESGALNEAFSDIFGTCIEFYALGADSANWLIGDKVIRLTPYYMRSMSNPKATAGTYSGAQPHTYKGQYWASTANGAPDNGGVHTNSGVANKWFYLLSVGGTGSNDKGYQYNMSGITIEKAEKIAYRTLTTYLSSNSNYNSAFNGSKLAATDLYGANSPEYNAVVEAWKAVGVPDAPTSVQNVATSKGQLSIFPNPATTQITINSKMDKAVQVKIANLIGQEVMRFTVEKGQKTADVSTLSKGIYLVTFETENGTFAQKMVLQ